MDSASPLSGLGEQHEDEEELDEWDEQLVELDKVGLSVALILVIRGASGAEVQRVSVQQLVGSSARSASAGAWIGFHDSSAVGQGWGPEIGEALGQDSLVLPVAEERARGDRMAHTID
uniref:Uncharacterized protein n=1 Tax=Lactuca sativa TaxID=4236 RepID=A0A9R1VGE1_LACSA|nr:hypothetical protein LSAT_V11C500243930 [Lactuca sativa]